MALAVPHTLSPSKVASFKGCALAFRFSVIDKLPEPLRSERAGLLAQGTLRILPGTHHLHMEQPAAVAAAIDDFLVS